MACLIQMIPFFLNSLICSGEKFITLVIQLQGKSLLSGWYIKIIIMAGHYFVYDCLQDRPPPHFKFSHDLSNE
jgi:hypothetical protein